MSYDSPYVVGAYSGGGAPDIFSKVPGAPQLAATLGMAYATAGALIVVLVVLVIMWFMGVFTRSGYVSGGATYFGYPNSQRWAGGSRSDGYGGDAIDETDSVRRALSGGGKDTFLNARESPYYPDVSNRVLRIENREQEAIRAFNKINQTRVSRGGDDSAPLPWKSFWSEWQTTHGDDSDGYSEGFGSTRNDTQNW